MATIQPAPRPYELMTVLVPELGEDDLSGQIDRINGQIADAGGSITAILRESPWGRRRLAYTIRHNGQDFRDGYYVVTHFTMPPARMTELERELKLNVQVIRYLVVHDDPKVGERARDPELVVEHSDAPATTQPAADAATAAEVLRDPDAVETDAAPLTAADETGATPATTDPDATAQAADASLPDTTLAEAPPVKSQTTPPPVNASNSDEAAAAEEPATATEDSARQADEEG